MKSGLTKKSGWTKFGQHVMQSSYKEELLGVGKTCCIMQSPCDRTPLVLSC